MDREGRQGSAEGVPHISDGDFELLSRFLDGELPLRERGELEARLAREKELATVLEAMRTVDARLREAMSAASAVPDGTRSLLEVPDQGKAAARDPGTAKVLHFPGASARPRQRFTGRWPQALAASMVLAVGVFVISDQTDSPPVEGLPGNDALVSAALDTQTSGSDWLDLADGRSLQPVLTFEHRNGGWCREYLLRGTESDWRGVACRDEGRWVTQAAGLESYLEATDAYRPAGAGDSAPVAVFINQHAADIALGLQQEISLIRRGWE